MKPCCCIYLVLPPSIPGPWYSTRPLDPMIDLQLGDRVYDPKKNRWYWGCFIVGFTPLNDSGSPLFTINGCEQNPPRMVGLYRFMALGWPHSPSFSHGGIHQWQLSQYYPMIPLFYVMNTPWAMRYDDIHHGHGHYSPILIWLVVGPPLWKNMKVNWDDYSQYMGK